MRKRLLWLFPWLLAGVLLVWVWRLIGWAEVVVLLRQLDTSEIVALGLMNGLVLLIQNGRWWLVFRGLGYRLPYLVLTGYRVASFGLSYFTPGPLVGGEPLQVYLVERHHGVPRTTAIVAMVVDKVLEWMVNVVFLVVGVAIIVQQSLLDPTVASRIGGFTLLFSMLPFGFLVAIWRGRSPMSSVLQWGNRVSFLRRRVAYQKLCETMRESERQTTDFFHQAPGTLVVALVVSIIGWVVLVLEYWMMLSFLGINLTFVQLMAALAAARVALLVMVPGGLGVFEASQVMALSTMGFTPAAGVSVSFLIRLRDVLLGGFGLWWGSKKLVLGREKASLQKSEEGENY